MSQVNGIEMFIILGFMFSLCVSTIPTELLNYIPKIIIKFLVIYGIWIIEMYLLTKIFTNLWN